MNGKVEVFGTEEVYFFHIVCMHLRVNDVLKYDQMIVPAGKMERRISIL